MPADLHPAIWDGPYPADLPDGRSLQPGDEHLVSSEDLKSSYWKPVSKRAQAAAEREAAQTEAAS